MSEGFTQGPYMAAGVGFEPAIFRMQGTEPTTEPPRPTFITCPRLIFVTISLKLGRAALAP